MGGNGLRIIDGIGTEVCDFMLRIGQISTRFGDRMLEGQVELADYCLRSWFDYLRRLPQLRNLTDLAVVNTELTEAVFERVMARTHETLTLAEQTRFQYTELLGLPKLDPAFPRHGATET